MKEHMGVESVSTGKRRGKHEIAIDYILLSNVYDDVEFLETDDEIHFTKETDAKYKAVSTPVCHLSFSLAC